jgi:hypothetical protein
MDDATLRSRLAQHGVGLFRPAAPGAAAPAAGDFAALVAALAASDDPRLVASLPCLFVLHDAGAPAAATTAAAALGPRELARLGRAWRLARAFAVSHGPDIVHLFGRPRRLPPLPIEPADLPEPDADFGERCPAIAREMHDGDPEGNLVGDFVDLFETWLRLAETERAAAQHA